MRRDFEADIVIVGAGSAGCLLANRLSADPSLQVLLIEAGGVDSNPWIHVPLGYAKTIANPSVNWCYKTEPAESLAGRQIPYPLGKTMGGSSSINGLAWVHGQAEDYDEWEVLASPKWGRSAMRQALLKVEHVPRSLGIYRGRGPGVGISVANTDHPLLRAAMDAGVAAGLKANPDYNSGQQNGIGPLQVTTMNGRRVSVVDAFIKPIAGRTNLRVLTSMQARRVLWQERQAVGVEVLGAQGPMSVIARREVVLSAGAIHSPQLLMLSGIGPSYELQQLGLEVCADSPGVGQNLQDHVQIRCVYEARNVATLNQLFHSRFRQAWAGMQYSIYRSGWLAQGALRVVAFTNANGDTSRPDLQLFFSPLSTDQLGAAPHKFPGMSISVVPLRPKSRGYVSLISADIKEPPRIHMPLLEHPADMSLAISGINIARQIASQSELKKWIVREVFPGKDLIDYQSLEAYARQQATTIFHPVGTCRMGSTDDSVVDTRLRVRGVHRLRVVDASIMPNIVSGNTNATTLAIAEQAAAMMKEDLH